jgi:hypothetical protein
VTVNREHKPVRIATLDPYAGKTLELGSFPREVQEETLELARSFWRQAGEGQKQTTEERRTTNAE